MRDDLLLYYERELNYLRQLGAEFAEKYPKIASRLVLETDKESADPHVERLLEGFAFLAARVHLKIDDEFPEITEALLSILYPHYIRPLLPCRSWRCIWMPRKAARPRRKKCRADPPAIRGRSPECPASSAPVSTPRCGR